MLNDNDLPISGKYLLVTTTIDHLQIAKDLAHNLIKTKLAACVNIVDSCESIYLWENEVQSTKEYKLFIKTQASLWDKLLHFFKNNHTYSVFELTAIPIHNMNPLYANWLEETLN